MPRIAPKRSKYEALRALRESGKKAFDSYEVQDVENLYEEVDETQYKKIVRDRLNQDDFVVDDNGEGYADDGREEWDRIPMHETESEDETPVRGKDRKACGCAHVMHRPGCWRLTAASQPRKLARTTRRGGMPTTETSPSTSLRGPG